ASGALPPAFPAVCIDGDPYWDGGIYSNTPIETVFDDHPRRDSIVFTVQMWHAEGPEPESVWQVFNRQKDIQYASRADSHIARQCHIHHFRHVIRELVRIDFTSAGIHARWHAGFADTMRVLERRPWEAPIDPMAGVAVYDSDIQS